MKFFFKSSKAKEAVNAKKKYVAKYGNYKIYEADIIVPIGGDGFLLKSLHDFNKYKKPFYGINFGSIGFLMNSESKDSLIKIISKAQKISLNPLQMKATDIKGKSYKSIAFNEVSIMRQTHQAAKLSIEINNIERMKQLICDGVLISTAAGSTAYNFSAHGSIIPLESKILALTPISAFRPRRWRGALLTQDNKIKLTVNDAKIRTSSVTADNKEFRNIRKVEVVSDQKNRCELLFNNHHSIDEKILKEQFSH